MQKGQLLYEGKAKKIYATNEESIVWIEYKDSATAFNGVKQAEISGKGRLNNEITSLIFSKLCKQGVESHFIEKISPTEQLVNRVQIIPLEVVVRNMAAGSLSKRTGLPEGTTLKKPMVEFYYKNDSLGDPLFTTDHIFELSLATKEQIATLQQKALEVNEILTTLFKEIGITLVDFKLEFGVDKSGRMLLADEISPDTCRLWDADTNEKLDKDVFRRELGSLTAAYEKIFAKLGGTAHV